VLFRSLDLVAEVYDKARQQGKIRWLGISAHNDKVFQRVLNDYPQFSVILFPCLFLTRPQGGVKLLKLAREKDVGVIGIKPFGAGATFGIQPSEISGKLDTRAHILLKAMLADQRIAAIIPGVNDVEQLAENVKGSYERDRPMTDADRRALGECEANFHAHVTPDYEWLHHWKTV
jgi:predicted aldo/keto reductase-like oxidoreductase